MKARSFKHWVRHTEWERRANETYVFSVAKDASLAGDEVRRRETTNNVVDNLSRLKI